MRAPIIVVDDDTDVFHTVEAAERYLEPWSVESGALTMYDRDGLPLIAQISKTKFLRNDAVIISERTGASPEPEELRKALTEFLTTRGVEVSEGDHTLPLERLWEMATEFKTS